MARRLAMRSSGLAGFALLPLNSRSLSQRGREMRTVTVYLVALALAGATAILAAGPQVVGRFEGIWKKCYEPGLEGVSEIDTGFLVLMPDSRYYELSSSCCYVPPEPQPPFWSLDSYSVANDVVTLKAKRFDGSAYEIPLHHRASARAVFFDAPRSQPIEVEALLVGDDLNHAWCRVYPESKR